MKKILVQLMATRDVCIMVPDEFDLGNDCLDLCAVNKAADEEGVDWDWSDDDVRYFPIAEAEEAAGFDAGDGFLKVQGKPCVVPDAPVVLEIKGAIG